MAIVGMLDQDALLCVAAHNYPVSVIARKDTTCGHTVNLPPEVGSLGFAAQSHLA